MPLETEEGMTTVLLSQQSGRHWNGCSSQTPMLVPGRAQPSLGAARAQESWERAQGLPSGRDCPSYCPSCTGTTPALWHSQEGQGEVTGARCCLGIQGAADPEETREAEGSLLSWEAHTAWMADKPPRQLGSELRACPGE